MARRVVVVEQDKEKPIETRVLAKAIVEISAAYRRLLASGLNRRAIVTLVAHSSRVPVTSVGAVLDSLKTLAENYTE